MWFWARIGRHRSATWVYSNVRPSCCDPEDGLRGPSTYVPSHHSWNYYVIFLPIFWQPSLVRLVSNDFSTSTWCCGRILRLCERNTVKGVCDGANMWHSPFCVSLSKVKLLDFSPVGDVCSVTSGKVLVVRKCKKLFPPTFCDCRASCQLKLCLVAPTSHAARTNTQATSHWAQLFLHE